MILSCAGDDAYALPMAVMLYSALRNHRGKETVEIHILDGGISPANRARIGSVLAPFDARVNWLAPRVAEVSHLPLRKYLSSSTYLRLLLPELLPDTQKVLFLDSDLLIDIDLAELWAEKVGDRIVLAAGDAGALISEAPLGRCPAVRYGKDDEYLNAGVLVMNLAVWRREGVPAKIVEFCSTWREIEGEDQAGLNAIAIGRWGKLDEKWNRRVNVRAFRFRRGSIFHFSGYGKPWLPRKGGVHGRGDVADAHRLYDEYVRDSGWFTTIERSHQVALHVAHRYLVRAPAKLARLLGVAVDRRGRREGR